jgi:hypothetical protein
MSPKDRITLLKHWEKVAKELIQQMDKLNDLFNYCPESSFSEAIWRTLDAYTDTLATLVGDNYGWMGWYQCENEWGEKELVAKARMSDKLRPIRNIKDLARLIERSQQS